MSTNKSSTIGKILEYIHTCIQPRNTTYSVFMLRMALRDIIASVTAFLNCLREERTNAILKHAILWVGVEVTQLQNFIRDSPHCQIHGPNGKQGEGVDLYHNGHKGNVQQHFDKAWEKKKALLPPTSRTHAQTPGGIKLSTSIFGTHIKYL